MIMGNTASVVLAHPSPSSTRLLVAHPGEQRHVPPPELSSGAGGGTLAKVGLERCNFKAYQSRISFQLVRGWVCSQNKRSALILQLPTRMPDKLMRMDPIGSSPKAHWTCINTKASQGAEHQRLRLQRSPRQGWGWWCFKRLRKKKSTRAMHGLKGQFPPGPCD